MADLTNDLGQPIGATLPDWERRPRPPRAAMHGHRVRLEPIDLERHCIDLFDGFALDTDGRNWTYLPVGPFSHLDDFRAWMTDTCFGDDPLFHAIIDLETGKAVGFCSYLRIDPRVGSIEVGYINFTPVLQRTAASTEAMFLMMQRAFDELGYRRYEWKCDDLNGPSRAAAARLGFTFEGVFRQATIYKGRSRDTAWFSITDAEWPAIKAEFVRWLDPSNFDEHGLQLTPLRTK